MDIKTSIIKELDEYSKAAGVEPSTVCRKATGNPRLHYRLQARLDRATNDIAALRKYMADNPVNQGGA